MKYVIVSKISGITASVGEMDWDRLMEGIDLFIAFNPKDNIKTDQDKFEYFNNESMYKIKEVA